MTESTKVEFSISPEQADCLQQYGCLVAWLSDDDSIPVGHQVTVKFDDQEQETIIVAIQKSRGDKDTYVLAEKSQVHQVT